MKIPQILHNILHDKILLMLLALSFSIFSGLMVYSQNQLLASLIQPSEVLVESELQALFTEQQNIKEVEIRPLSERAFIVEFLASEGRGNSLHPFSFVVVKEGGVIVDIQEMGEVPNFEDEEIELDFIDEAIDVQVLR